MHCTDVNMIQSFAAMLTFLGSVYNNLNAFFPNFSAFYTHWSENALMTPKHANNTESCQTSGLLPCKNSAISG